MKSLHIFITSLKISCIVMLAVLASGAASLSAEMVPGKIEVAQVTGDAVFSVRGEAGKALKSGDVLPAGVRVSTSDNSTAHLWLPNGAHLAVQPGTVLSVATLDVAQSPDLPDSGFDTLSEEPSYSNTQIEITKGKIIIEVNKLRREPISNFEVRSNAFQATVKSASAIFLVEQSAEHARVATVVGSVVSRSLLESGPAIEVPDGIGIVYRVKQGEVQTATYWLTPQEIADILYLLYGDAFFFTSYTPSSDNTLLTVVSNPPIIIPISGSNGEGTSSTTGGSGTSGGTGGSGSSGTGAPQPGWPKGILHTKP